MLLVWMLAMGCIVHYGLTQCGRSHVEWVFQREYTRPPPPRGRARAATLPVIVDAASPPVDVLAVVAPQPLAASAPPAASNAAIRLDSKIITLSPGVGLVVPSSVWINHQVILGQVYTITGVLMKALD